MKPKVSIITPVYNCEKYIERCIYSLLNQTYENIEIIIIDDGSKDRSAQIIEKFLKETEKVKYIYQENSGPGVARNKAIKEATGKYILFVDSDDYISENYIDDLVSVAEDNNSELVIAGYTLVYAKQNRKKMVIPKYYERSTAEGWAYRISACCSRMYLRQFWEINDLKFNVEKKARAEDVPIVLFTNIMAKNIAIVKTAGYYYFQHPESAMNKEKKEILFEFPYKAFEEIYKKVNRSEVGENIRYFDIGVLKFLAQFDIIIYRKANRIQRQEFYNRIYWIIKDEINEMVYNWKKNRVTIDFTVVHKIAIEYFILKYFWYMKRNCDE